MSARTVAGGLNRYQSTSALVESDSVGHAPVGSAVAVAQLLAASVSATAGAAAGSSSTQSRLADAIRTVAEVRRELGWRRERRGASGIRAPRGCGRRAPYAAEACVIPDDSVSRSLVPA